MTQKPKPTLLSRATTILIGFVAYLIYVLFAIQFYSWVTGIPNILQTTPNEERLQFFVFSCIIAPLTEEVLYRHAPLQIAKLLGEKAIMPTVLATSVMFGAAHGHGYYSLIFQGVMGLVFSWVYIKNGFHYWSSVTIHFLWNTFCMLTPI